MKEWKANYITKFAKKVREFNGKHRGLIPITIFFSVIWIFLISLITSIIDFISRKRKAILIIAAIVLVVGIIVITQNNSAQHTQDDKAISTIVPDAAEGSGKTDEAITNEVKESSGQEEKVEESKTEEAKAEESKTEEAKAEESKAEESKTEDSKSEESIPAEAQTTETQEQESKQDVESAKDTSENKTTSANAEEANITEAQEQESKQDVESAKDTSENKTSSANAEEAKPGEIKAEETKTEETSGNTTAVATEADIEKVKAEFERVRAEYPETVAWLYFEDGSISYPIMQCDDNTKYLSKGYTGEEAWEGAIFLDSRSSSDFSDPNSIVYGHNMKDGTMFGAFKKYKFDPDYPEYYRGHQYFQIITPEKAYRYQIFAYMDLEREYKLYNLIGEESIELLKDMEYVRRRSYINTDEIDVDETKNVVTLSTCTPKDQKLFVICGVRMN